LAKLAREGGARQPWWLKQRLTARLKAGLVGQESACREIAKRKGS
jgi:hypothetical protein